MDSARFAARHGARIAAALMHPSPLLERTLRRHPHVIFALAAIPCAYFAARGTSDALAARILPPPLPVAAAGVAAPTEPPSRRVRDRAAIVRRNVFDSSRPPPSPTVRVDALARERVGVPLACGGEASEATPPCGLPWRVLGAVLGDDPRWSFAMVREREGTDATPVRVGATLAGHAVLAVSACLRAGAWVAVRPAMGARCYVAERMPAVAPRAIPLPEPAVTGVERVGERAWEVRRDTVESVLADPMRALGSLRVMPAQAGGRAVGMRVRGVARTPLQALGIEDDDVIRSVNGLELTSPDGMLEAWVRLRTSDQLRVEILRGGVARTHDVSVR
jgi:general secretion pathway protein C